MTLADAIERIEAMQRRLATTLDFTGEITKDAESLRIVLEAAKGEADRKAEWETEMREIYAAIAWGYCCNFNCGAIVNGPILVGQTKCECCGEVQQIDIVNGIQKRRGG